MAVIDWIILSGTLLFIVGFGVWKTKDNRNVDDYVKGGNNAKWWTIGLSVMATQASAITFLSTPGQAFHDGMGFVQFYFGLPLAMIVICIVFIPIYHKLKVFTAYEMLEKRFDLKTRTLAAVIFLVQRGLAAGITIFAPSIILSAVLGWDLRTLNIIIGSLVIIYTVSGGTKAVSVTQKQQMFVILFGMFFTFFFILGSLPNDISFSETLKIAGANGKLNILDFEFDWNNRYNFWSGTLGAFFLFMSYFGADQSQVQRYLSGKSIRESQLGLIFNALLKVPLQFFILLVGVMVFVFYQYNPSPLNFNPAATEAILASGLADDYTALKEDHQKLELEKRMAQNDYAKALKLKDFDAIEQAKLNVVAVNNEERMNRDAAKTLISEADEIVETNDKDYVFIHFILNNLPKGLIGLLLAVILSAAMSSTASELNALGTISALDLYKRNKQGEFTQKHYVTATKWFTLIWGVIAIIIACVANLFDNLIQLVNIIGSIFYGNVLGIFLIAFFLKFVKGNAVFIAALVTQAIVILGWHQDWMSYLWLNAFGCALVVVLALLLEVLDRTLKNPPLKT
ncbi:hypothetical protein MTsPCn5_08380 [Croceitalea sp. MTPC5]|uniref:sodium:solute symporter n=1 Tax=Croceitalea sp. MTPC5 TaxID=3056565 RepID=UPI002B3D3719|nr:hypothetical protein MTsPCn5_08380 [Croceitalea sp. MTPC5]